MADDEPRDEDDDLDDLIDDDIKAIFNKFDADGSGDIDASELRNALQSAGLIVNDDQTAYMLCLKYDDDRGATLDLHEFAQLVNHDISGAQMSGVQERLKVRSKLVEEALTAWWAAAMNAMNEGTKKGDPRRELAHNDYIRVMKKVYKAMSEDYDEAEALSVLEGSSIARPRHARCRPQGWPV